MWVSRVIGTSVSLKNRFAGYNIELVVREDSVQQIMDLVTTQLTGELRRRGNTWVFVSGCGH